MARAELHSLRFSRLESRRLLVALLLSLFVHLGAWSGYEVGKKLGWWQKLHTPAWLHQAAKKNPPPPAQKDAEPPLIFVDVSHPDPEPPKKTRYYSNKNSQAANPDAAKDTAQPKLNGQQKDVPKTEDAPRLPKLQPSPPPPQEPPPAETKPAEETHPHDPMSLGDLKLRQVPEQKVAEQKPAPPRERPRTLKQAQAEQQPLPGQQLQQAGGVRRQRVWSSLDAKATAFGDYDRAIVEAVTQRWYDLLDSHRFAQDRTGKVILHFKLKPDGSVEELKVLENTVGELLGYVCEESVQEAAPFGKWPADMKRMINANFREITFTFYYY
jgi:outer membrane biosynthesis protein TonB